MDNIPASSPPSPRSVPERGEMADLAQAYASSSVDAPAPTRWTPAQVQLRLVEAFDVLRRTPMKIGPRGSSGAWPAILIEWEDLVDESTRERVKARVEAGLYPPSFQILWEEWVDPLTKGYLSADADEKIRRDTGRPSSFEIDRADEAMNWCARYLGDEPLKADALHLHSFCIALDLKMAKLLRRRTLRADALVVRRQAEEDAARERRRKNMAAEALQWRARRLADDSGGVLTEERIANITANARIRLQRELERAAADVKPIKVRRGDVWPGKVFTRWRVDHWRKEAAAAIAAALNRDKVAVR